MKTRAIVQINASTGQKNITFTQDEDSPVEDFLAPWPNSEVHVGEVLMLSAGDYDIMPLIAETELRSVDNDYQKPESGLLSMMLPAEMLGVVPNSMPKGMTSEQWDLYIKRYVSSVMGSPYAAWERTSKALIDSVDDDGYNGVNLF